MPLTADGLLGKSPAELDALFSASPPGALPDGEGTGTAIARSASIGNRLLAWFARWFCWQGKVFNAHDGRLVNRISPFSIRAIKAEVYRDKSWLDGRDVIVLDYSRTSLLARKIRDEIREITRPLSRQGLVGKKTSHRFQRQLPIPAGAQNFGDASSPESPPRC